MTNTNSNTFAYRTPVTVTNSKSAYVWPPVVSLANDTGMDAELDGDQSFTVCAQEEQDALELSLAHTTQAIVDMNTAGPPRPLFTAFDKVDNMLASV